MIVWINGAFGVGKTTTAGLVAGRTDWRVFDPEHVGYLLQSNMAEIPVDDFQDLGPWRTLVPLVADEIFLATSNPAMIAVQTVLDEAYWTELRAGFARRDRIVHHVLLDCQPAELRRRIEDDEIEAQAKDWRLDHLDRYAEARRWLIRSADSVLDTTDLDPGAVADRVIAAVDPTPSITG